VDSQHIASQQRQLPWQYPTTMTTVETSNPGFWVLLVVLDVFITPSVVITGAIMRAYTEQLPQNKFEQEASSEVLQEKGQPTGQSDC